MAWLYYRHRAVGVIRIEGGDRHRFLQELTTNDLGALAPDQAVFTVLTNAAGRILDVVTVLEDDDAVVLLTQDGYASSTLDYLGSRARPLAHTEPLAYMRKMEPRYSVSIHDESNRWDVATLLPGEGPPPGGLSEPPWVGHVQRFQNRSGAVAMPPVLGGGLLLIQPRGVTVMVMMQAQLLDSLSFEAERIRRGIPGPGTELTAEFSPFEVGLGDFVDLGKISFPGKAILAHESRHQDRGRILVGLSLERPAEMPASVRIGDNQIGPLTSCVQDLGKPPHALAVVQRRYATDGVAVTVVPLRSEQRLSGKIMRLPWQGEQV